MGHKARSGNFLGRVIGYNAAVTINYIDATRATEYDSGFDASDEQKKVLHAWKTEGAGVQLWSGESGIVDVFAHEGGLLICDFFPEEKVDERSPKVLQALYAEIAPLPVPKKSFGRVQVTSGWLALALNWGNTQEIPKDLSKLARAPRNYDDAHILVLPVPRGTYQVFATQGEEHAFELGEIANRTWLRPNR